MELPEIIRHTVQSSMLSPNLVRIAWQSCLLLFPLPAALNFPGIPLSAAVSFSLSLVNTNVEYCPLSLISSKNILLQAWLRGLQPYVALQTAYNPRGGPAPACAGWPCFGEILTGHSFQTLLSHRGWAPLWVPSPLAPAPICVFWVLICHQNAKSFESLVFLCRIRGLPHGTCFFQQENLNFSHPKTIKNPFKSHHLQLEQAAGASSSVWLPVTWVRLCIL